jgi:hypothetical protein
MSLQVGQLLYGFCGGHFGRESYWGPNRVESIGYDWIVVRDSRGIVQIAAGRDAIEFLESDEECKKSY